MFSLIISIIAIALVAALALASIYYGGSAFQEGSADAEASTVVNQGQQVQGAVTLADVDEFTVADEDSLVTGNYLKEVPSVRSKSWALNAADLAAAGTAYAWIEVEAGKEVCEKIEVEADAAHVVGTTALDGSVVTTQAFGCLETGTTGSEVYKAYYKM